MCKFCFYATQLPAVSFESLMNLLIICPFEDHVAWPTMLQFHL